MDELLRDFLTETHESIDVVDVELVRFEQEPNNAQILSRIFRLVHAIKGTCGFLNLPRLERLTHAAETLIGNFRDGAPATSEAVSLILATIDRIKLLLDELERNQAEQAGDDRDLIEQLERAAAQVSGAIPDAARAAPVAARGSAGASASGEAPPANRSKPAPAKADAPPSDVGAEGRVARKSIRVHVDTLEQLMTMVSELVLTRTQLLEIVRRPSDSEFKAPLQRLSNVTAERREGGRKTAMQRIGNAWQKLPRIVRDLPNELGKPLELEMHGAETELDRQVLDMIKDPLTHMVRNSADHGIEHPAVRAAAGKPEKGTIRLSAWHEGGHIIIEIADDGRGLDAQKIKAAAVARGLATEGEVEKMSDVQAFKYIFTPGFSTASQIT